MRAVTIAVVSRRAATPMVPIGSSSAPRGSHCTSSGRSVPSGRLTAMTIVMASSGSRPGMNGHAITRRGRVAAKDPGRVAMCGGLAVVVAYGQRREWVHRAVAGDESAGLPDRWSPCRR